MPDQVDPDVEVTASASAEIVIPTCADPVLTIVIVTFGTGPVLLDALRSIVATTAPTGARYEVIVVDNPSAGAETLSMLTQRTAGVRLVRNETNIGFGPANDVGARIARGRLLCLCNPDIVVPPGWLAPLERALNDPVVGVAAPVLLNPDGSLQEAGQLLYNDGCTAAIGGPEVLTQDTSQLFTRDVDYASAAFWLLRRDEYLGFNPRLVPAYFEDVDYALRLEGRAQVTRLVADVPVVHVHGGSTSVSSAAIATRSRDQFVSEWQERLARQFVRPSSTEEMIESRDRACAERIAVVATSVRRWREAMAGAIELGRGQPRSRVALLADHASSADLQTIRTAGVEVCVGPPPATLANRPGWATRVVTTDGHVPRTLRTAVRLFHPRVSGLRRLSEMVG